MSRTRTRPIPPRSSRSCRSTRTSARCSAPRSVGSATATRPATDPGSTRILKIGPLPAFEETTTKAEPHSLIEYKISKGGPLRGHWGVQKLTPTADGGTTLDYTIGFDMPIPGMAPLVGKALSRGLKKGLPKLAP